MCLGQPAVQRDDTGLGAKAKEGEHEAHGCDRGAKLRGAEIRKGKRATGEVGHGEEARHDEHKAHVRDHKVEPTAMDGVLVLLDHDQEVRGQRHELKGDQEPKHVSAVMTSIMDATKVIRRAARPFAGYSSK